MTEIQGKSILVRVSARFELSGVDCKYERQTVTISLLFKVKMDSMSSTKAM